MFLHINYNKEVYQLKLDINTDELKIILAYIAVCILWGSTYVAMRIGVAVFPPLILGGIRFLLAGSLMALYAHFKGLKFPDSRKEIKSLAITGLIMMFASNGLVLWAEQWVHSGSTSLILATTPLCIAIVELFLPDRARIGLKGWLGLLIGFGGVALLVKSGTGTGSMDITGALLLLLASFLWGGGSVYSKRIKPSGSLIANIAIQTLSGGIGQLTAGALLGQISDISFSIQGLGALLYLAIFGSVIGYSSYIYVLQKWPAVKAGTYAYINPVVAVMFGAILLGEPVSPGVIVSAVIILCGVLLVQLSKTDSTIKQKNKPVPEQSL